ncbi:IscS subfamily cysteine desulfurase [Bacillus sp. NPDC077027]|uniref:IscS subfamily cysteine desulfurase n=1 Tax=Bacillus sp. NPDC077027 TaxID=3390548 RepID=UPI003CFFB17A
MIYLDYAASAPVSKEALQVFQELSLTCFGNASSLHDAGGKANDILSYSRNALATMLDGEPSGVFFTSGGTEANLLAIQSIINGLPANKRHFVTTKMEHPSIHYAVDVLTKHGVTVSLIEANDQGFITEDILEEALLPETGLVSIQHANSETGIIQPLARLSPLLKRKGIFFHTDAVQTFGKIPVSIKELGVDAISISGHKVYAPKGAGAVYIAPEVPWKSLYADTVHENGFRPGTVNVPIIGSFIAACEQTMKKLEEEIHSTQLLREYMIRNIHDRNLPIRYIKGEHIDVLPHIFGCFFEGFEGQYVMLACNRQGICISTGSACASGYHHPSPAIKALHMTDRDALQFIRISFGRHTSEEELDQLLQTFSHLQLEKKGE